MATSAELGREHDIALTGGTLRYRDLGDGPPVVFVHGLLANGDLWRDVVPAVAAAGLRCLTPDLPLGSHRVPVPGMDLTPPGVAAVLGEFLTRLDLRGVTLVANDTGGAITQILLAENPERVARVVLTSCDALERFLPPQFAYLPVLARLPGAARLFGQAGRLPGLLGSRLGFGMLSATGRLPSELVRSFLDPMLREPAIRADLVRFARAIHRRHTLAAAGRLHRFDRPALLTWATDDPVFPMSLAHRLAACLPDARVVPIDGSGTFVPVDRPAELARLVVEFTGAAAPQPG